MDGKGVIELPFTVILQATWEKYIDGATRLWGDIGRNAGGYARKHARNEYVSIILHGLWLY
jgi:hypothetical protein